jgi:hypothetical protein
MTALRRIASAALALGLAVLAWRAGAPGAIPTGAMLLLVPLCMVVLVAQTLSEALPRWARRFAHGPLLSWLLAVSLSLGQFVRDTSGVPAGVLVLGLFVLPPLGGLVGVGVAWTLWYACFAAVLALALGWLLPLASLTPLAYAAAWWLSVVAGLLWLLLARKPAPPPPTPAPAFDLNAHLDSPDAQEGADKYTRE